MTYLYGDSTDSGLELNYIELLRDFLDFAAQIVLSEHRIQCALAEASEQVRSGEEELARLRALSTDLNEVLSKHRASEGSETNRAIEDLSASIEGTLTRHTDAIKNDEATSQRTVQNKKERERASHPKHLEPLLLRHQLPDSAWFVDLLATQERLSYRAETHGSCKQGLSWRFVVDIPKDSAFSQPIRVSHYAPELSIQVPEKSGLVRKSVKLKTQKLSGLLITSFRNASAISWLSLRTPTQGEESGYDIELHRTSAPQVSVARVTKGERGAPFEASPEDAAALADLSGQLQRESANLMEHRCALTEARFDNSPLRELEDPLELLRRLIARIAPVIQDISAHSLAPTELILKRVLADDRREEIFASVEDLRSKIAGIPPEKRRLFAPLGLESAGPSESAGPARAALPSSSPGPADLREDDETTLVSDRAVFSQPAGEAKSSVETSARRDHHDAQGHRVSRVASTSSTPSRQGAKPSSPPPLRTPVSGAPKRPSEDPPSGETAETGRRPAAPVRAGVQSSTDRSWSTTSPTAAATFDAKRTTPRGKPSSPPPLPRDGRHSAGEKPKNPATAERPLDSIDAALADLEVDSGET